MDTILFIILLAGAIVAAKGLQARIVVPVFVVGALFTLAIYHHHVTSKLDLSF